MVLVAIAAAAPKGGLIPGFPDKTIATSGGNDGNSTGLITGCGMYLVLYFVSFFQKQKPRHLYLRNISMLTAERLKM